MTIIYKEVGGKLERKIVASEKRHRGDDRPHEHMSQRILRTLYDLECSHRFRSTYTKSQLKKVHETAIERWRQTGEEV